MRCSNKGSVFPLHPGMLDSLEGKKRQDTSRQGTVGVFLGDRNQE
jgi:hypothetical protein